MTTKMNMAVFPRRKLLPYKDDYYLWSFVPSIAAAVIFIILFLVCSVAHTWKMWQHKMWFCSVFVIGGYRKSTFPSAPHHTESLFPLLREG